MGNGWEPKIREGHRSSANGNWSKVKCSDGMRQQHTTRFFTKILRLKAKTKLLRADELIHLRTYFAVV